ncbi:hypothetical protein [Luteibacter sp. RCC_6_2]|uniref:hypothetical protein n=1 Tax=Luteibacter sp. RCC_6_2 TaxID=3239223 RepID=UPI0035234B31
MSTVLLARLIEAAPGVHAWSDGGPTRISDKPGMLYAVRLFFDVLEEPDGRAGVRLDLLPREYVTKSGKQECMPEGHRIFCMTEEREDCDLRYFIEIVEPQSLSRKSNFSRLVEACEHHGLNADESYYREYDAYDLGELRQQLAQRRRQLIREDAYAVRACDRAEAREDWPNGKENVTWLDGMRGFEFGDWVEITVQYRGVEQE